MPRGLRRYQRSGELHHVTFSCARHRAILGTEEARDAFLGLLERTREMYGMEVHAYVAMATHVHLLVNEPEMKPLSVAMQILKQRFSRTRAEEFVWEPRYYDFNVRTNEKRLEKIAYIHWNPVEAGVVERPEDWRWSSYRDRAGLGLGAVKITR